MKYREIWYLSLYFMMIFSRLFSKHDETEKLIRAPGCSERRGLQWAALLRAPSDDARRRTTSAHIHVYARFFGAGYGRPREVSRQPSRVKAAGLPSPFIVSAWCEVRGAMKKDVSV
jgi:hypothetical protein